MPEAEDVFEAGLPWSPVRVPPGVSQVPRQSATCLHQGPTAPQLNRLGPTAVGPEPTQVFTEHHAGCLGVMLWHDPAYADHEAMLWRSPRRLGAGALHVLKNQFRAHQRH